MLSGKFIKYFCNMPPKDNVEIATLHIDVAHVKMNRFFEIQQTFVVLLTTQKLICWVKCGILFMQNDLHENKNSRRNSQLR